MDRCLWNSGKWNEHVIDMNELLKISNGMQVHAGNWMTHSFYPSTQCTLTAHQSLQSNGRRLSPSSKLSKSDLKKRSCTIRNFRLSYFHFGKYFDRNSLFFRLLRFWLGKAQAQPPIIEAYPYFIGIRIHTSNSVKKRPHIKIAPKGQFSLSSG